jgi:hypothetical protein
MHAKTMKHSASLWDGEVGASRCIDVVHWEGDITPEQLIHVANQITTEWQMIDMQLDPLHAGRRVWVHGYHYEVDAAAGTEQPFFYDVMFSTMFITLDHIEALCDKQYGEGVWDEYSLYLDDKLPTPLPMDF